jgi:hypothetical protein
MKTALFMQTKALIGKGKMYGKRTSRNKSNVDSMRVLLEIDAIFL